MPAGHAPLHLAQNLDRIHLQRVQRGACGIPARENQSRLIDGVRQGSAQVGNTSHLALAFLRPWRRSFKRRVENSQPVAGTVGTCLSDRPFDIRVASDSDALGLSRGQRALNLLRGMRARRTHHGGHERRTSQVRGLVES